MQFSCLLQGSDTLTIQCGMMLLDAGHKIAAVITSDDRVNAWASEAGITTLNIEDAQTFTTEADWLLSIANTDVIPDSVLGLARKGAVNFHDGPLPRYAGLNAPVWALLSGEETHGITWHVIEGGIDEGAIVANRSFDVSPDDTALTLNAKCFSAAIDCFDEVVAALEAGLPDVTQQDLTQRSYFGLKSRPKAGATIDFNASASDIARMVRALDHGDYRNPLSVPKIVIGDQVILARKASATVGDAEPGTILAADDTSLTVAASEGAVHLSELTDAMGSPAKPGLAVGSLILPTDTDALDLALKAVLKAERRWEKRFGDYRPALWREATGEAGTLQTALSGEPKSLAEALAVVVSALADFDAVDIALGDPAVVPGATLAWRPVRFEPQADWGTARTAFAGELERAADGPGITADLPARCPALTHRAMPDAAISGRGVVPGAAITLATDTATLHADLSRISEAEATLIAARITHLAAALSGVPDETPVAQLPILPPSERDLLLNEWNATDVPFPQETCIHQHFQAQVKRTPNAPALIYRDQTLSFGELNARANQLAHVLMKLGVGPGKPVGLHVKRSPELLIGALGIMKAGGAYLPLDPAYPEDRIKLYIEDSDTEVIVTDTVMDTSVEQVRIDNDPRIDTASDKLPDVQISSRDLAYMIYTSGSTGRPKGVMIEHRNVSNFFTGMDARVSHQPPGVLLAVTSLSFDISVLEIFWSLSRGFRLVLSDEEKMVAGSDTAEPEGGMDFSLFYWGNDDGVGRDKYGLLLEGAKFADENGFCAVWTPERHFHAFGGLYPNPSVTGAAVAAVTKNIAVRAGSCVAPLHHPARIAEEWAVIDNLTNGRTGIAIASGWQPDDFVLRPENTPPNNKPAMMQAIDEVRKLWRGEEVEYLRADGTKIGRLTQPRPVSKELAIWVTTAGNPETWRQAGEVGANVLTHLLGQTIEEVGEKIEIYHAALRAAGHNPDDFKVTLMLHTFIASDREEARKIAREPMKNYLRSAADLIKQYAWAFPAFKRPDGVDTARQLDLGGLEPDELEAILDFAFERYFEKSGLFGTIEDAMERVREVRAMGVGEVACLIDYGIDRQTVLDGLRPLAEIVALANTGGEDYSLATGIERHGVTHLQCTPYMARMLVTNEASRATLGKVQNLMIGGEALSPGLVADLEVATNATIENMYGPTETTIWSTTARANGSGTTVRIGRPISNTRIYVLDDQMQPVPVGVTGNLYIGGEGVARGYWKRDDLTAERFLPDPFRAEERIFNTGDLARWHADGQLEFLGRSDAQVKIRGYRIELGEIEAVLESQPGVTQAVVIVREDASGVGQLQGYIIGDAEENVLKHSLGEELPNFMVPNRITAMDAFPLTPNKKVDRKALPQPGRTAASALPAAAASTVVKPTDGASAPAISREDAAATIAAIWCEILNVERINPNDNFFDLGGHSLLAVEAHRAVRDRLDLPKLSIADIFRAPTLGGFTARAESLLQPDGSAPAKSAEPAPAADATINRRKALRGRREQHQ